MYKRQAAEQGHAEAQCHLGIMYANGQGVEKDESMAVKWYRKAAEQGHTKAQANLGFMYATGKGVPQSFSEALRWLRKAEAQRHEMATATIQEILQMQSQQKAAAPPPPPPPSPSSPIPISTTVRLRGLQVKPELNGQRGVVTDFDASSGRCSVQLEDGRGPYKIKPENLEEEVMVGEKRGEDEREEEGQ